MEALGAQRTEALAQLSGRAANLQAMTVDESTVDVVLVPLKGHAAKRWEMLGAPGHGQFSNHSNERRGTSPGDALQLPLHSDSFHCRAGARRQLLKVADGGPSRDSLVTVRARSRWAGRPAAGRFRASMSRIKIQSPPGGCWCRPARQAGVMPQRSSPVGEGWPDRPPYVVPYIGEEDQHLSR
jgi:hypothetical protein